MSDAVTLVIASIAYAGGHARDLLLISSNSPERAVELAARVGMFDRKAQARFGRASATCPKRDATEVQNSQRHLEPFAGRAEHIFLGHRHIAEREACRCRAADAEFFHARFKNDEALACPA
jgi:hypothetical protein